MANDGRIYITISDRATGAGRPSGGARAGGGRSGRSPSPSSKRKKITDSGYDIFADSHDERIALVSQATNLVVNQAKEIINYQINNIGNFTGNYNAQRQVSNAINTAQQAIGIGMAFATNWVLGTAALVGTFVGDVQKEKSNMVAFAKNNYHIDQLRNISGLNALTNGSR